MARSTPMRMAKIERNFEIVAVPPCAPAGRSPQPPSNEFLRGRRLRAWRGVSWPVNEVLLAALVRSGKSREDIARLYAVAPERVDALRDAYGL